MVAAALAPFVPGALVQGSHEGLKRPHEVNVFSTRSLQYGDIDSWANPWATLRPMVSANPSFVPSKSISPSWDLSVSNQPSHAPTISAFSSRAPSKQPSLSSPDISVLPTAMPSARPSLVPSSGSSSDPSLLPSDLPTTILAFPSRAPSKQPSLSSPDISILPTVTPFARPPLVPSFGSSSDPSSLPSNLPITILAFPSRAPSKQPSLSSPDISVLPTATPSARPPLISSSGSSSDPSSISTNLPTVSPSTEAPRVVYDPEDYDFVTCPSELENWEQPESDYFPIQVRFFYNIHVATDASVPSTLEDVERKLLEGVALALLQCGDEEENLTGVLGVSSGPSDEVVRSCKNECHEIKGSMTVRSSGATEVSEVSCALIEAIRSQTNMVSKISGLELFMFLWADFPCPVQEDTDASTGGIGQKGTGDFLGNQSGSVKLGVAVGVTAGAMVLFVAVLVIAKGRHMQEQGRKHEKWNNIEVLDGDSDRSSVFPTPRTLDEYFDTFSPTSSSSVNLSPSSLSSDKHPDDEDDGESQVLGAGPSPWRETADIEELKSECWNTSRDDAALLMSEKDSKKGPIRGKKIPMSAKWGCRSRRKKKSKDVRHYQSCAASPPSLTPVKEHHGEESCSSSDGEASSEIQSYSWCSSSDGEASLLSAQGDWEDAIQNRFEAKSPDKTDLDNRIHTMNAPSPVVRLVETPAVPLSWREIALKPTSEKAQTIGEVLQLNIEGDVIRLNERKKDSWSSEGSI